MKLIQETVHVKDLRANLPITLEHFGTLWGGGVGQLEDFIVSQ